MPADGPDDGGFFTGCELAALMDEEATHTLHKYSFSACRQPKCCLLIVFFGVFSISGQYYPSFLVNSQETAASGDLLRFSCLEKCNRVVVFVLFVCFSRN